MELVQELFVTAFIAVFFSFIVAKLVSVAMAGDSVTTAETKKPVETVSVKLEEKFAAQSEKKVEFVQSTVESVDRLESESVPVEKIVEETVISGKEVESEHKDVIDVLPEPEKEKEKETEKEAEKESGKGNENETEKEISRGVETESGSCEEEVKRESSVDDVTKKEVSSDCHEEEVKEEGSPLQKDVKNCEKDDDSKLIDEGEEVVMNLEKKIGEEDEDDDWEGIERSELEKSFAVAAQYVGEADISDQLDGVSDDVRMQLYGLHKVATEGPCRESQPMPLMLSARAKWNAWQRLGNMNPDVAMEQYIILLSEHVPGWKEETASAVAAETLDTISGTVSGLQPESRDAGERPADSGIDEDNLNSGENTGIKAKE